ncbi:unnamed protein product, partial [marine sediment metagenome]
MENDELYKELTGIKARLASIENDISWFKKIFNYIFILMC